MLNKATRGSMILCLASSSCPRSFGKPECGTLGFPRSPEPSGPTDRGEQIPICTAGTRFAAPCITTEIPKVLSEARPLQYPQILPQYYGILRNIQEYSGIFQNIPQELPSTAVSSKENETNEKRTKMNDEVATAGDSAPNWHEQPQWYM